MKTHTLIPFAALTLLLAAPLAAQTPDEVEPPSAEASAEVSAEVPTPDDPSAELDATASAEAEVSTDVSTEEEELPKTASPLALLALLGLGGSGAAYGIRRARRR